MALTRPTGPPLGRAHRHHPARARPGRPAPGRGLHHRHRQLRQRRMRTRVRGRLLPPPAHHRPAPPPRVPGNDPGGTGLHPPRPDRAGGRLMPAYTPDRLLERAEADIAQAAHTALDRYLHLARQAILDGRTPGSQIRADASPSDLPPNLEAWPDSTVWAQLVQEHLNPAIGAAFDEAFDAAARSDALQTHRHRQTFMDEVFDRLSLGLWADGTFDRIRGDLAEAMDAGDSITRMRERISDQLQVDRHSYLAERIARTESHAATEGGTWSSHRAWQEETGEVLLHQWIATADERTRPAHAAASGQRVPLDEPFSVGGASLQYPGDPNGPAEEIVNCFPGEVSVRIPGGSPSAIFRRWYKGPLYKISTKNGVELPATPNHPLLSDRGWVGAQHIQVGDKLIHPHAGEGVGFGEPGVAQAPARLDELYRTVSQSGVVGRIDGRRVNFHGDWANSDVDVVRSRSDLSAHGKPALNQGIDHGIFVPLGHGLVPLAGLGGLPGGGESVPGPEVGRPPVTGRGRPIGLASGLVSAGCKSGSFLEVKPLHPQSIGLTRRSERAPGVLDALGHGSSSKTELSTQGQDRGAFVVSPNQVIQVNVGSQSSSLLDVGVGPSQFADSAMGESVPDNVSADLVDPADVCAALAGAVALDEVIDVQAIDFSGHVYNLESPEGWYTANSIAVSNCRCSTLTGTQSELDDLPASDADQLQGSAMPTTDHDPTPAHAHAEEETATPEAPTSHWEGILAPLGVRGDFRILAAPHDGTVLTSDHMWLSWQEHADGGHDGKVAVGVIDQVWVEDENLRGRGRFDMADELAAGVARKVADGFAGTVSVDTTDLIDATIEYGLYDRDDTPVDATDMDFDDLMDALEAGELRELAVISNWRLGGATLVQDPAFHTGREGQGSAFIHTAPAPEEGAVEATTASAAEPDPAPVQEEHVATLTAAAGIAPESTTWAEKVASGAPMEPPSEWCTNPNLTGPTKVRVTDAGRVYGHTACWDASHIGFTGQQVRPPRSRTNYAHYRRHRVRCADGSAILTGTLVMGTGHARSE